MSSTSSNSFRIAAVALAAALSACGQSGSGDDGKTDSAPQSEFAGIWQAGGTFPGDCSDLECPPQYSFRLTLRDTGECIWKGQTRKFRPDSASGEWDYEDWHTYAPTQGACKWKRLDDWHFKMSVASSSGAWTGQLNGSVLDVTGPSLAGLHVHFSRLSE